MEQGWLNGTLCQLDNIFIRKGFSPFFMSKKIKFYLQG